MSMPTARGKRDPMADVRPGMPVLASTGEELGQVADVKMGDPEAVTTAGQEPESGAPLAGAVRALLGGSGLPDQIAARLIRTGYLKLDTGMFGKDRYAAADQVGEVTDGTVHLRVGADELIQPG